MKEYIITVNGKKYDVQVEERGGSVVSSKPATSVPVAAEAPAASGSSSGAGSIEIKAGAAGKVFKVESPKGSKVIKGQTILVLEVMKMETPVVAPSDGTVVSIEVSEGQNVDAGELLATMDS